MTAFPAYCHEGSSSTPSLSEYAGFTAALLSVVSAASILVSCSLSSSVIVSSVSTDALMMLKESHLHLRRYVSSPLSFTDAII